MLVYLYQQPKSQKKYKNHVNTFTWILSKSTNYDGASIIKNRKDNWKLLEELAKKVENIYLNGY